MKIPVWLLPNPYITNVWATREQLTKESVTLAIQTGMSKHLPILEFEDHRDVRLHASRVAHFVLNGWSDLIYASVQFTDQNEPYGHTFDGVHRLAAALYLDHETINAIYDEPLEQLIREKGL